MSPRRRSKPDENVIALIGAGALARSLAPALLESGASLRIASRRPERARALARALHSRRAHAAPDFAEALAGAGLVLLCVRDDALPGVARELASRLPPAVVLHASGFHGAAVLRSLARRGWSVGSLHPLLPLPRRGAARASFAGAWFTLDGDRRAQTAARRIVRALGGRELGLARGTKPEYHLAATLVSNAAVALFEIARAHFERAAADPRAARAAFAALLAATAANLGRVGPRGALTGAISRGDVAIVRAHLARLRTREERAAYRALGRVLVRLAGERGGTPPADLRAIARLLD